MHVKCLTHRECMHYEATLHTILYCTKNGPAGRLSYACALEVLIKLHKRTVPGMMLNSRVLEGMNGSEVARAVRCWYSEC